MIRLLGHLGRMARQTGHGMMQPLHRIVHVTHTPMIRRDTDTVNSTRQQLPRPYDPPMAIISIVLAAISLTLTGWLTWAKWPRLGVDLSKSVSIGLDKVERLDTPEGVKILLDALKRGVHARLDSYNVTYGDGDGNKIRVIVVNRGAEPMSIYNVGIEFDDKSQSIDYISRQISGNELPAGQPLPCTIGSHGCEVWTFNNELIGDRTNKHLKPVPVRAYAERYKSWFGWHSQEATKKIRRVYSRSVEI